MKQANIIWIMSDDLSYRDIGPYGQRIIQTPCLDQMAAAGMRFTQGYAGSTVCAPSRCSLLTGMHMGHARVRENSTPTGKGDFYTEYADYLRDTDVTVAEVLKSSGYKTGLVGKWAVGHADSPGVPWNKGFDHFFGFLDQARAHCYYPEVVWRNETPCIVEQNLGYDMAGQYAHGHSPYWDDPCPNDYDENGNYIPRGVIDPSEAKYTHDMCTEEALRFISDSADNPFFLYLAYQIPHGPLVVPSLEPYTNRDDFPSLRHKEWAAMVTRMDTDIGKIMDLTKELNIEDDTLIVFASDNGYAGYGYFGLPRFETVPFFDHRGPFQGGKFNLQEGGVRVPLMMKWPGKIRAGSVTDAPFAFWDFLPTAAELADAEIPDDLDGLSFAEFLKGTGEAPVHEWLYWEYKEQQAVRIGEFRGYRPHPSQPVEVYRITTDPGECINLAATMPDLVTRMEEVMVADRFDSDTYRNPWETVEEAGARNAHLPSNIHQSHDPEFIEWLKGLGHDTEPFGLP